MEKRKEDNGYSIHFTDKDLAIGKKCLRVVEIGFLALSLIRFLIQKGQRNHE